MFAMKRVAVKFGAPGPKSWRGSLKGISFLTVLLSVVFIAGNADSFTDTYPEAMYCKYFDTLYRANITEDETKKSALMKEANDCFNKGVARDMSRTMVDGIFVNIYFVTGQIKKIDPTRRGDLNEMVYVRSKYSIVFVYDSRWGWDEVQKRAAIAFKNLAFYFGDNYHGKIKFFVYDVSRADDYKSNPGKKPSFGSEIKNEFRKRGWKLKDTPCKLMYSTFDLVKGKTADANEGGVELIDALCGAPSSNSGVLKWLCREGSEETGIGWVNTNIMEPNGSYLFRLNNSWNFRKIYYSK